MGRKKSNQTKRPFIIAWLNQQYNLICVLRFHTRVKRMNPIFSNHIRQRTFLNRYTVKISLFFTTNLIAAELTLIFVCLSAIKLYSVQWF